MANTRTRIKRQIKQAQDNVGTAQGYLMHVAEILGDGGKDEEYIGLVGLIELLQTLKEAIERYNDTI